MEKILATVNGIAITEAEVERFIAGLGQRAATYNNPEGKKVVLQQLINNKLLLLDAKRNLLEAEPEFKAELARLRDSLLVSYASERVFSGVKVTDKDAEEYYEANKEKFNTGDSANASHILVESEELALELIAKIKAGEISFEDAAREHSTCPSKENGGNLGDFGKGQMVPEFDSAVFSMTEGELTEKPVKTQFGYHIIRLNSKKASEPMPYESISADIKDALLGEKRRKAYESKINQLKILYPVDVTI